MSVKKPVQKKCNSLGFASKRIPKKSILKNASPKLQLESDSDGVSEMNMESDAEIECNNTRNKIHKFSKGVSKSSDSYVETDGSDSEHQSYDGDYNGESATDDESIISCGEDGSEHEDGMDDQENNHSSEKTENTVHATNNSMSEDHEAGKDTTVPSKQQQALANVMGSLLKKKKSVVELMNKPKSTSKENERKDLTTEKRKKKRKAPTENVLEIVGEDGTIEKVEVEPKPSKKMRAATEETKEIVEPGKRHFPTNSRTDPYCQDPYLDPDVVKEKKLRSLATQGVVELFNTLEQFRQQGKDIAALKEGRPGRMFPRQPEVSAITSGGKAGLIDFLMKKGKGGAGLTSRTADRPLFSEVKRDECPLE